MALPFRLNIEVKGKWAEKVYNDLKNPDPEKRKLRQKTLAEARKIYEKYYNGD